MTQIWFYKGKGKFFDKVIRWWTKSVYSHCEVVVNDMAYSADAWNNVVRATPVVTFNRDNWDVINVDAVPVTNWLNRQLGKKYDYLGILGFVMFGFQKNSCWYCSELCAEYLGIKKHPISPEDLYQLLEKK